MRTNNESNSILEAALSYAKLEAISGISIKFLSKLHSRSQEENQNSLRQSTKELKIIDKPKRTTE